LNRFNRFIRLNQLNRNSSIGYFTDTLAIGVAGAAPESFTGVALGTGLAAAHWLAAIGAVGRVFDLGAGFDAGAGELFAEATSKESSGAGDRLWALIDAYT